MNHAIKSCSTCTEEHYCEEVGRSARNLMMTLTSFWATDNISTNQEKTSKWPHVNHNALVNRQYKGGIVHTPWLTVYISHVAILIYQTYYCTESLNSNKRIVECHKHATSLHFQYGDITSIVPELHPYCAADMPCLCLLCNVQARSSTDEALWTQEESWMY